MSLETCKKCYLASMGDKTANKAPKEKSSPFILCDECSKELDRLKSPIKVIKTIRHLPYEFQIYEQCGELKIDLNDSPGSGFHNTLVGSFMDIQHCEEAIEAWLGRPLKAAKILVA